MSVYLEKSVPSTVFGLIILFWSNLLFYNLFQVSYKILSQNRYKQTQLCINHFGCAFVLLHLPQQAAELCQMERCEKLENSCLELIDEKIELGRSLADKIERDFIKVDGALKTKRSIDKEIQFLQKVSRTRIFSLSRFKFPSHFS